MYVEYSSNNSGGGWWLSDKDWRALEAAGWTVLWAKDHCEYTDGGGRYIRDDDGVPKIFPGPDSHIKADKNGEYRWLGGLAKYAYRRGLGLDAAVAEFERITGQRAAEPGCSCCGQPHNFTEYDSDGKLVAFGPDAVYDDDDGGE